jgi:hypothetical protein
MLWLGAGNNYMGMCIEFLVDWLPSVLILRILFSVVITLSRSQYSHTHIIIITLRYSKNIYMSCQDLMRKDENEERC